MFDACATQRQLASMSADVQGRAGVDVVDKRIVGQVALNRRVHRVWRRRDEGAPDQVRHACVDGRIEIAAAARLVLNLFDELLRIVDARLVDGLRELAFQLDDHVVVLIGGVKVQRAL